MDRLSFHIQEPELVLRFYRFSFRVKKKAKTLTTGTSEEVEKGKMFFTPLDPLEQHPYTLYNIEIYSDSFSHEFILFFHYLLLLNFLLNAKHGSRFFTSPSYSYLSYTQNIVEKFSYETEKKDKINAILFTYEAADKKFISFFFKSNFFSFFCWVLHLLLYYFKV